MESRVELIAELREKFFKKLDDEGSLDRRGFHPADIDRVKHNDDWLRRFLEHNEYDLQKSLSMLWEVCNWRKKFGANDITEDNVRKDYLEEGVIFSHGKDKDGKTLFIIKSKLHIKGVKDFGELQRCIVYWFERLEREGNGNQISLFFDMGEAGLSNLDMEFIKYLIGLFNSYYPNFLNYIIIFEMPWVLNAAFKIIKSWLPPKALPKIKSVNKSTLKDFVDLNDILKCWGGTNDYTFTFVSEEQSTENTINGKLDSKKVHFAENSPISEQPPSGFGDQISEEQLLSIEPVAITFNKEGNEIIGRITLTNVTTDKSLSYKIKTTSPQKFKVRPSAGIIPPSERCSVTVVLQSRYSLRGLLNNDRFLVMCLPVKNATATAQELATIWKSGKPAEEHRLSCCDGVNENNEVQKTYSILSSGSKEEQQRTIDALHYKIIHLEQNCNKLYKELKYLQIFSIILTVLMAIAVIYVLRNDVQNADLENCDIHHGI